MYGEDNVVSSYNDNPITSKKGFKSYYSNGIGYLTYSPYIIESDNNFSFLETKINIKNSGNKDLYIDRISYFKLNGIDNKFYNKNYIIKFNMGTDFAKNKSHYNYLNLGIGENTFLFGENISYFFDFTLKENDFIEKKTPTVNVKFNKYDIESKITYTYDLIEYNKENFKNEFLSLEMKYELNKFKNIYYSLFTKNDNTFHSLGFLASF